MNQPDPPKFRVPAFLAQFAQQIADFFRVVRPVAGPGISITDAPGGGQQISLSGAGIGAGGTRVGPWSILSGTAPGKVKVSANSTLLGFPLNDTIAITNIELEFTITVGDLLYIQINFSGTSPSSITLVGGTPWTEYPIPYSVTGAGTSSDPLVLTNSYTLVGYGADADDAGINAFDGPIIFSGSDRIKVVRCLYTPLRMELTNLNGGFVYSVPQPGQIPGP